MKKRKMVIGNWKMNPETLKEASALNDGIKKKLGSIKKAVAVMCPPALYFSQLKTKTASKKFFYGLQNIAKDRSGAFTGEISASMARNAGVSYVIVGHSERRALGETDDEISKKIEAALAEGIHPILCVGEPKMEDSAGYVSFIKNQLVKCLAGVPASSITDVIIAYEPLSAIGAKHPVTSYEIHQRNIFIKKVLADMYGKTKAFDVTILYGGSANAENAKELVDGGEVDGLLVGRASLDPDEFVGILRAMDSIS
jgi:triosephosphate isomerase